MALGRSTRYTSFRVVTDPQTRRRWTPLGISTAHRTGTGLYGYGEVFKLTPSNGGWIYTDLHDFTGGADGAYPTGSVFVDASGNLYGTTLYGGTGTCSINQYTGCGVMWEITP